MEQYAIVDSRKAPVVHVRVVSEPTDKNYQEYLDNLGSAFRKLRRFAMIFNTGELNRFPAKYREMQNAWLRTTEEEFRGRWICSAFVIKSRVIRGVLMTLYWLNEPYYDYKVCATEDEAWAWTHEKMKQ